MYVRSNSVVVFFVAFISSLPLVGCNMNFGGSWKQGTLNSSDDEASSDSQAVNQRKPKPSVSPTVAGPSTSGGTPSSVTPPVTPTVVTPAVVTPATSGAFPGSFSVSYSGQPAGLPQPMTFYAQTYSFMAQVVYVMAFEKAYTFDQVTQPQRCTTTSASPVPENCQEGHVTSVLFGACAAAYTGMCSAVPLNTNQNLNGTAGAISYMTVSVGVCEGGTTQYYSPSPTTVAGDASTGWLSSYTDRPGSYKFTALTNVVPSNIAAKTQLISGGSVTGIGLHKDGLANGALKTFSLNFSNLTLLGNSPACTN